MRAFDLMRYVDATGISGTGKVAEGVLFESGKVAMAWLTDVTSVAIYDSIEDVRKIHGHDGNTDVVFRD